MADALAFDSGSEVDADENLVPDVDELRDILSQVAENEEPEDIPDENFRWSEDFSSFTGTREEFNVGPGTIIEGTSPVGLFTQ